MAIRMSYNGSAFQKPTVYGPATTNIDDLYALGSYALMLGCFDVAHMVSVAHVLEALGIAIDKVFTDGMRQQLLATLSKPRPTMSMGVHIEVPEDDAE